MKKRILKFGVGAAVLAVSVLYLSTSGCATFGGKPAGDRLERMEMVPQYQGGKFVNDEVTHLMGGKRFWSTSMEFIFGNGQMRVPTCPLPLENPAAALKTPPDSGLRITWLGHSTSIIEIDGSVILTDPMWSERASPFTSVGPKRFHPPPLAFENLPRVDAVVISHDHYDHLDMETVRALAKKGAHFHVGVGVGAHLERWGVPPEQMTEHVRWQEAVLANGVRVVSTPSRHFSGRGLFDRNSTLWTSWTLIGNVHRVFFSGDTGRTAAFAEIAKRYGPFDVAMLEIGQYHPAWGDIHLGPHGAIAAHQALGAKRLFPIHWATFELGLHAWSEPPETLYTEAAKLNIRVLTPRLGESIDPTVDSVGEPWWRAFPPMTNSCPQPQL